MSDLDRDVDEHQMTHMVDDPARRAAERIDDEIGFDSLAEREHAAGIIRDAYAEQTAALGKARGLLQDVRFWFADSGREVPHHIYPYKLVERLDVNPARRWVVPYRLKRLWRWAQCRWLLFRTPVKDGRLWVHLHVVAHRGRFPAPSPSCPFCRGASYDAARAPQPKEEDS